MREYFQKIIEHLKTQLRGDEHFSANLSGESSDFCRFNQGKVRQAGQVEDFRLGIRLLKGKTHILGDMTLSRNWELDRNKLDDKVVILRDLLDQLPEDPYFLSKTLVESSTRQHLEKLAPAATIVKDVLELTSEFDFVGILATGNISRGFANSFGQLNWYETETFNLDWSLYLHSDKAVKQNLAGLNWNKVDFANKLDQARQELAILKKPSIDIKPGKYRVYLSPSALSEVFGLISWSSFGIKNLQSKTSSLLKLYEGQQRLSPLVNLRECTAGGTAPDFDKLGFLKPSESVLIEAGQFKNPLISARSGIEFDLAHNGANEREAPESLALDPGELPMSEVLNTLGTGLYINNLWYLNFSDQNSCRMTGMTRFAAFWVENGKITAPFNVMRFDESLYRMLGDNLVALTKERELLLDPSTYNQRATSSQHLPGAIIKDVSFTL